LFPKTLKRLGILKTKDQVILEPILSSKKSSVITFISKKKGVVMKIDKILWPTDFSGNAEKALPYVQSLTRQYGAEIVVLYVIQDIAHHESWYGDFGKNHIAELMAWSHKSATKRLEQICNKYLDDCPLFTRHIAVGDPAEEILKMIDKEQIDMVVMATHGEKGKFPFGSVTEKVLKNAKVPITAIPITPDIPA
jgi:nucleotide-binding universal stress UspA family protein